MRLFISFMPVHSFISLNCFIVCLFCFLHTELKAQKPTMLGVRMNEKIKIDGQLDEGAWKQAMPATDFITYEPKLGNKSTQNTEIRILYDDEAIYIGAYLYDTNPDSIMRQFGLRDSYGDLNADWIAFEFDTYNDDQNAFGFGVTASGVQNDWCNSNEGEDNSWNAVWKSEVKITDKGWVAELSIPYSALRFSDKAEQSWGIGFMRSIRRIRELSTWQFFNPNETGYVIQFGTLNNISNIKPPLRLFLTPYTSAYYQNYIDKQNPENNQSNSSFRGGLDIKYGINKAFTLDMILIPDFGQVRFDDLVLNLSPFEIQFNENRPFFTEGTELFNKGNLFYSRRVGGRPVGYFNAYNQLNEGENITNNPSESPLYNAFKISGRTTSKLGLGVFNGITGETNAIATDSLGNKRDISTGGLTNYSLIVLDQTIKNGGFVSFTNANTMRAGNWRDSNVSAFTWLIPYKGNKYAFNGNVSVSQLFENDNNDVGFKYNLNVEKTQGTWRYGWYQNVESDNYNPNDMGILFSPNEISNTLYMSYNNLKGFGNVNRVFGNLNLNHSLLYKPMHFQNFNLNGNMNFIFKTFFATGFNFSMNPIQGNDYFEPRYEGRFSKTSSHYEFNGWVSTDYRKRFAYDWSAGFMLDPLWNGSGYWTEFSPRFRPNDKLFFLGRVSYFYIPVGIGYTTAYDDTEHHIIYGNRRQDEVVALLEAQYLFNTKMGIQARARHYWSRVLYNSYHELQDDGYISDVAETENYERNTAFTAFTVDISYRWQFAPGSELSLVWKQAAYPYEFNGSNHYNSLQSDGYFKHVGRTFDAPQTQSISLRILYFIDALSFRKKSR
jgi:hypothetical protein